MSNDQPRIPSSCPFNDGKQMKKISLDQQIKISQSAFPKESTYAGYLEIRTEKNPSWKRKYFVLDNNYLLCGENPYSVKLSAVIPLESSNILQESSYDAKTFELLLHPEDKHKKSKSKKKKKKKRYYLRAESDVMCKRWCDYIERASKLTIKDIYRLRKNLGSADSQSAKVIAAKHRTTKNEVAIKIIDKRKCNLTLLIKEIQILKQLNNPYIVELNDLFETRKYFYIIMEFCRGGELFDRIANLDGDHFDEVDCCQIMHQLASGVEYMHKMGIVHRDLKPENILCVEDSIKKVKIADFGISAIIDTDDHDDNKQNNDNTDNVSNGNGKSKSMKTRVGTLSYTAPEILTHQPYDKRVDYWSLGVILYILCCGYPPFDGENDYDVADCITNEPVEFEEEDWGHISPSTKDLVKKLLSKDPTERSNTNDIIKNVWRVQVTHSGFKRAHNKLKETMKKRKHKGGHNNNSNNNNNNDNSNGNNHNNHNNGHNVMNGNGVNDKGHIKTLSYDGTASAVHKKNNNNKPKHNKINIQINGQKPDSESYLQNIHSMNYRDSFVINENSHDPSNTPQPKLNKIVE